MKDLGAANGRSADVVATATLAFVALVALAGAWFLPWWEMQARAPQYGQRTLVVEVNPRGVRGDVFEVDNLGHYVGIRKMESFAPLERTLAPFGLLAALAGIAIAPWFQRRWLRFLAVLPAVLIPVLFLLDLNVTMNRAANDRNPDAALNLILSRVDTKLFGEYVVAQFRVTAKPAAGLYLAGMAALLGLGLAFAVPVPWLARRRRSAVAASVGLLMCLLPRGAQARDWPVRDGESIAGALALAEEGDSIVISGNHREHLTVSKRVRLLGHPGSVLDGGGQGTVLRIEAGGVEVIGLELRGSGDVYDREDSAIRIDHAADVRLERVRVEDALFGIFAVQADRCAIEGVTVIGKDLPAVRRGDGIRLWYSSKCRLIGNTMDRSRDLIIWYSAGTLVEDNLVRRSRYGLHYMYSNDNAFRRNRFEDNEVGAAIMYSHGIHLEENAFSFSNGTSAYGLLLKDADDVFITRNRFVGNSTALFFDGAPQSRGGRVEVRGNLIARNDVGVALQPSSRGIRLWENAFIGNRIQVQVQGPGTAIDNVWAVGGRGNYWSDALVYDADGDGVSELPYRLESTYEVLADRYPVLAFFDSTPGAEAIDLGARLFPIFAPRPKLIDPSPLTRPPLDDWTASRAERTGNELSFIGAGLLAAAGLIAQLAKRAIA